MKVGLEELTAAVGELHRSPSPPPSPAGRGRIIRRLLEDPEPEFAERARNIRRTTKRCCLSPGERVRVRASVTTNLQENSSATR